MSEWLGALGGAASLGIGAGLASHFSGVGAKRARRHIRRGTEAQLASLQDAYLQQQGMMNPLMQNQQGALGNLGALLGLGRPGFGMGPNGFSDPNLNRTQLGADNALRSELGYNVFNNPLMAVDPNEDLAIQRGEQTAGQLFGGINQDSAVQRAQGARGAAASLGEDELYQNVMARRLAADSMGQDERFRHARDTAVYGDTFEESPGYAFQREQMERAMDRRSAIGGGSYGGRAMQEALRQSQGLAAQEFNNWARGRQMDLGRQDAAAAAYQGLRGMDASRGDMAAGNYMGRRMMDLQRGDAAVMDARRREEMAIGQGDRALDNYLARMMAQRGREDQSIMRNQQMQMYDLGRQDMGYQNYLAQLMGPGGAGSGAIQQMVGLRGGLGAQRASVFGTEAQALAQIDAQQQMNSANQINNAFGQAGNMAMMAGMYSG